MACPRQLEIGDSISGGKGMGKAVHVWRTARGKSMQEVEHQPTAAARPEHMQTWQDYTPGQLHHSIDHVTRDFASVITSGEINVIRY